ncbi:hypothetical protein [Lentibacillus salinarum]|uniref:DUF3139 domain-containing protein n=1 Tax=Lentibacillus salinarum TaxID=446820 RepID=A0ABW3ZXS8_9BACI
MPYVLFVIALALIIITANIDSYQDEIRITHNQTEQLKIETLLQMARTQFKDDIMNESETEGEMSYDLPYGHVLVEFMLLNDKQYLLYFTITTDNGAEHSIRNWLDINSE